MDFAVAKSFLDKNLNIDTPTLILKRRDLTNIGNLIASEIKYKDNFASANELSFKVYKFLDEKLNTIWEEINDYNIIYIPEYDEYFDIHVSLNEEECTYKVATCTSLPESELFNTKLYNIEINTDKDLSWNTYTEDYHTVFYRDLSGYDVGSEMYIKLKNTSLLHRILDKASNYEIGHIDSSLLNLKTWYQFSISDSNIYDELQNIAELYHCLFVFEIKKDGTRRVNVYDLYNTCLDCNYRGEFYDSCPECGSTNFSGAYGKDTTIFTSKENLATSATIESNKDQLKNCFRVSGGDDFITDTISKLNPNGTNYYYSFSEEMLKSMPESLKNRIESYNDIYNSLLNEKSYYLNANNVKSYNSVINYIKEKYPSTTYKSILSPVKGYDNIAFYDYETIDIIEFLKHLMMPTIEIDKQTIDDAAKLLTTKNLSPVAVTNPATSTVSIVNNAVLGVAKVYVNTALYKIEIDDEVTTYTKGTIGTWNGTFILTSIEDNTLTKTVSNVQLSVNSDKERYLKQKLNRILSSEENCIKDITNIDMDWDVFCDRITYYSSEYLTNAMNAFDACISNIINSDIKKLVDSMKDEYERRSNRLEKEIQIREQQIDNITNMQIELQGIESQIKDTLNFEKYLGKDLWRTFCSYRREDSYQNENYISDGLNNADLIKRTQQLIDDAKKELYKASNMQYTINSSLNNLLVLKDFQPIIDNFECGNWIHVMIDDKLYDLRLLSYEIDYDNIDKITVEFSTIEKIWSGISDIKSVLDSASSIAGSYSSTVQQVKQTVVASKYVNNWVDEGFSATATKIVNNADYQDIVIDRTGILCRTYDDVNEEYDLCQTKIIGNGIYVTNDGWSTVKGALGKYVYTIDGVEKIAYGLLAETIVGKFIIGEQLQIQNSSGSLKFDTNGFCITNDKNTIRMNPNGNAFELTKGTQKQLYID